MPAIVKQFAALWLPHHMVEVELLVPELEDAEVDEDKRAAVAIRKDLREHSARRPDPVGRGRWRER